MVFDEDQEFRYNYGFDSSSAAYLNVTPIGGDDDSNMLADIFEEYQQLLLN